MTKQPSVRRFIPAAIGTAIVVAAVLGLVFVIHKFFAEQPTQSKREVPQVVQIVRPPPPPVEQPPPPPPEEKIEEPLPQDTPEPEPDNSPVEQLGLDSEGVAGGDSFGL